VLAGLRTTVALLVQQLAMGWMTEGSEFESQWGQTFSLLHVVQTGFWVHRKCVTFVLVAEQIPWS
jgi:hypothetical protein